MGTLTLRPVSDTGISGDAQLVGAANVATALRDNSDASFIRQNAGNYAVMFAAPSLPTGAAVKTVSVRARVAARSATNPAASLLFWVVIGDVSTSVAAGYATLLTLTPTNLTPIDRTGTSERVALSLLVLPVGLNGQVVQYTGLVYEVWLDYEYVEQPRIVMTAPSGTISGDERRPRAAATPTLDPLGGDMTWLEVRYYTEAQYTAGGFDPATTVPYAWGRTHLDGYRPNKRLPDGRYRAYGRGAQTINGAFHWSPFAYSEFTIDSDYPLVQRVGDLPARTGHGRIVGMKRLYEEPYDFTYTGGPVARLPVFRPERNCFVVVAGQLHMRTTSGASAPLVGTLNIGLGPWWSVAGAEGMSWDEDGIGNQGSQSSFAAGIWSSATLKTIWRCAAGQEYEWIMQTSASGFNIYRHPAYSWLYGYVAGWW